MALHILEAIQLSIFTLVLIFSRRTTRFQRRVEILILSFVNISIYLIWRIFYTVPHETILATVLGWILLGTEILGFIDVIPFYMIIWRFKNQKVPPIQHGFKWPTVDFFIATYNEPVTLLEKTIWACKAIDYPDGSLVKIYLCDDGHREEVRQLSNELDIGYLTRNDNQGAKAGNLNNALIRTKGQLIVTLDADMIPNSQFLMRTVPFMQDIHVGFVQTPQAFYNEDILRYDLFMSNVIPDEQDFFNRVIQMGRSSYNASIYSGSNTLFRRQALMSVGGFQEGTITEDFATGMLIQSKGWNTKYLNEVLAVGLSPETMEDLIQQRIRWGRGVVQTFKHYNPFTLKGLSISQRILYFNAFTYWFSGIFRYIFLSSPLIYALFGVVIFVASPVSILSIWLTQFLASRTVFNTIVGKYATTFWRNAFDTALFTHISKAVLKELLLPNGNLTFKVTPKDRINQSNAVFKARLINIQIIFIVLSLFAFIRLSFRILEHIRHHDYFMMVNDSVTLFWVTYNMSLLVVSLFVARERPRLRGADRFYLPAKASIYRSKSTHVEGMIANVSETGIAIRLSSVPVLPSDETYLLQLHPHCSHYHQRELTIHAELVLYESRGTEYYCALRFVNLDKKAQNQLVLYLYDRVNVVPLHEKPNFNYLSFVFRYLKSLYHSKRSISMSRKSPRLAIHKDKRIHFWFSADTGIIDFSVHNINHTHILVSGSKTPDVVHMTTLIQSKKYEFKLELEKRGDGHNALYRITTDTNMQVEDWYVHVADAYSKKGLKNKSVSARKEAPMMKPAVFSSEDSQHIGVDH